MHLFGREKEATLDPRRHANGNDETIERIGGDIIGSERFDKARTIPHHFDYDVAAHSIDAAQCALSICRLLERCGISVDEADCVRASLLHDLGMTEDEVFASPAHEKAYTHPVEAARIARDEFDATDVQLDAIAHHMWPIGHITPHHLAGWVLVAADKVSSVRETGDFTARAIKDRLRKVTGGNK